LSDTDPIVLTPRRAPAPAVAVADETTVLQLTRFDRFELDLILRIYGRLVASGEFRDYAIDMDREKAIFSFFRRTSEVPLYRLEKDERLARKQGLYSVVAASGFIMKRGNELSRVLAVLDKPRLVAS
jgi:Protein of unknown function (DUF2794)